MELFLRDGREPNQTALRYGLMIAQGRDFRYGGHTLFVFDPAIR